MASEHTHGDDLWLAVAVLALGAGWGLLTAAAWLSARLSGGTLHDVTVVAPFRAMASPSDPSGAWRQPVGSPATYWTITGALIAAVAAAIWLGGRRFRRPAGPGLGVRDPPAGRRGCRPARAAEARNDTAPLPHRGVHRGRRAPVGHLERRGLPRLGRGLDRDLGTTSLGQGPAPGDPDDPRRARSGAHDEHPPRQPHRDAARPSRRGPGGRLRPARTGTRDLDQRPAGPRSAAARTRRSRWSAPRRSPRTPPPAPRTRTFWQASAEQAVRCLLHAAALGGCTSADLYRWSLSSVQAREAVLDPRHPPCRGAVVASRPSTRSSAPTRASVTRSGRW